MNKLALSIGVVTVTAALAGCGVATTSYSPAYTSTYRTSYPVKMVRTYPVNYRAYRNYRVYPVGYYNSGYVPVSTNYWNTGYTYPYGTNVYYGSRMYSSWWGF